MELMLMFKKIIKRATNLGWHAIFKLTPKNYYGDKFVSYIRFYRRHGRFPKNQMLFNDVLYKIKTSDEILDPVRGYTSDKEHVKDYVKGLLGDEFNVPTIDVLRSIDEVHAYDFPAKCVVKPTHSSGKVLFRLAAEELDVEQICSWLGENYYRTGRELNYKFLKPKIIVEPFIFGSDSIEDIKFFCFKGEVKIIQWDFDRHTNHTRKLYSAEWEDLGCSLGYPVSEKTKRRPKNLTEMISAAEILSKYFDFVRVDMFTNEEKFLIGEITHVHGNAGEQFYPKNAEKIISDIIFNG